MKKLILSTIAAVLTCGGFAAEWSYGKYDEAAYQRSADAIAGVRAWNGAVMDGNIATKGEVYSDTSTEFNFPAPADVTSIAIYSKWIDSGRVNFGIKSILVKQSGASDFTALDIPALAYSEVKANGVKAEISGLNAKNIDALKVEFSKLQNGFIGIAEFEFRGKMSPSAKATEDKKPVPVSAKPKAEAPRKSTPRKVAKAPEAKPEVVRPRIALKKGEWCYDPDAKALTDGVWSYEAEARGDKLEVGKVKGWPKKVSALDLSGEIKNVFGDKLTITRFDPKFGHRGPDTNWAGAAGPAAGFVGAVKLPGEGLVELGDLAFCGCTNASGKIVFPKSMTKFGGMGFCRSKGFVFESCPFGENVKEFPGAFFEECEVPDTMSFPYVETLNGGAFKGSTIKSVSFGKPLKKINGGYGSGPFTNCRNLESVKFDPESKIDAIASFMVNSCPKLRELDLRSCVSFTCPQGTPFEGCTSLQVLRIGKVKTIPKMFFKGLTRLAELHFDGVAPTFEGEAFDGVWRDGILHRPYPGLRTATFVHVDRGDSAALESWSKLTADGAIKESGSVWGKAVGGVDAALRPLLIWKCPSIGFTEIVDADEAKGGYGYLLISRADGETLDTTVPVTFAIGGTAKPGQTYCSIWPDIWIPAGEKSAKVKIRPLNDPKTKKDATVVLKLDESESYKIAKREATLKVMNGAKYGGYLYADAGKWNLLAHMGNSGVKTAPKANTVAAAKYVLDRGYVFENDIQLSKNGVMYLDHDNKKDGDCPQDWPDTFENTLKILPKGALYKVDAKCGMRGLDRFIAGVKADKTNERALLAFNSWDEAFCRKIHAELPGAEFWLPVMVWRKDGETLDLVKSANRIVSQCKSWGAEGISIMWVEDVCTDEFFEIINAAGITIDVWTIDDMRTVKEAINRGARYITTNRPIPITAELPWAAEPVNK